MPVRDAKEVSWKQSLYRGLAWDKCKTTVSNKEWILIPGIEYEIVLVVYEKLLYSLSHFYRYEWNDFEKGNGRVRSSRNCICSKGKGKIYVY